MKCLNCENPIQENDIYCPKCGIKIIKSAYYVIANIFIFIFTVLIIGLVALFIASFLVWRKVAAGEKGRIRNKLL